MKFLKLLWNNPAPLAVLVLGVGYICEVSMSDYAKQKYQDMIVAQQHTIAAQQHTIESLQKLDGLHDQLQAVGQTNSVLELQKMAFISSMVTVQMVTEKINHHEDSLSWEAIWLAIVEQYNDSGPRQKIDPRKGLSEETVKSFHQRSRL